jgi:hypothetical protein
MLSSVEKCNIGRCNHLAKYRVRFRWRDRILGVEGLGDPILVCEKHAKWIRRTVPDAVWVDGPPEVR